MSELCFLCALRMRGGAKFNEGGGSESEKLIEEDYLCMAG